MLHLATFIAVEVNHARVQMRWPARRPVRVVQSSEYYAVFMFPYASSNHSCWKAFTAQAKCDKEAILNTA